MRISSKLVFVIPLFSCVSAWPALQGLDNASEEKRQAPTNPWIAPGATDVRSPCPGTNTIANHGFINRNGRNITFKAYTQGFMNAFGFTLASVTPGANNALALCSNITSTNCTAFDLDMLNTPHTIEHDASLSRLDKEMANNQDADNADFNLATWNRTKAIYSYGSGGQYITTRMANTARLQRVNQAIQDDFPGWFVQNQGGSLTEHSFILYSMNDFSTRVGNQTTPKARLDWVDYWFKNQRLPTSLGWKKNKEPFPSYIFTMAQVVKSAGTYKVPTSTSTAATTTATGTVTSAVSTTTVPVTTTSFSTAQPISATPSQFRVRSLDPAIAPRATGMAIAELPSDLAKYPASALSEAKASATAAGGQAPVIPNLYVEELSPDELGVLIRNVREFRIRRQNAFVKALKQIASRDLEQV